MKTLILSLVIFISLSCSNTTDDNSSTTVIETPITPTLIGKSSISNPSTPLQNVLITNQLQWDSLLLSMNEVNNVSSSFTETNINFSNYDIVAAFRNPISNSGSSVDITNIVENQTQRLVTIQYLTNGFNSNIAQPFHIVKLPKSSKPVIFQ